MVQTVKQILVLSQRVPNARTPQEKTGLERQVAATGTRLDRLVYGLYGLTDDETKLVERATA